MNFRVQVLLMLLCPVFTFSQSHDLTSCYLFKIEHYNKDHPEYYSTAHAIVPVDSFGSLIDSGFDYSNPPYLLLRLTQIGGHFLANFQHMSATYSCMKYHDVTKAHELTKEEQSEAKEEQYFTGVIDSFLRGMRILKMKYSFSKSGYIISCYKVKAIYYVCNYYMGQPTQPYEKREGAFIKIIIPQKQVKKDEAKRIKDKLSSFFELATGE
ncbi:MAG: hypothetical protein H6550_15335 [Chitinophagales bacterium]|nr:hypothetical protein [Chitinophagales bacterium]